ncbi:MAG: DUF4399 domain-containing protein [Longimicrobiales bacterium]
MSQRTLPVLALLLPLSVATCGGDAPEPTPEATEAATSAGGAAAMTAASPTVTILEPADGAEISGASVTVRLTAEGVEIVPAGELVPGTGHHHLYLDADLTQADEPVPSVPGQIIHLGTGVSEYTFENVAPGTHRLITVVADGLHVPLRPWVVDTVTFTVR